MYHVHKKKQFENFTLFSLAYPWVLPLLLLTYLCFYPIYAAKMQCVNFLFLVETPATHILDYTLYHHEKGKCNALEKT